MIKQRKKGEVMKRTLIALVSIIVLVQPAMAKWNYYDTICTGVAFLLTGAATNTLRDQAQKDKDMADRARKEFFTNYNINKNTAIDYRSQANVYYLFFGGNDPTYLFYMKVSNKFDTQAQSDLLNYNDKDYAFRAAESRENIFKAVSIGSLVVGGACIVKGIIDYWKEEHPRSYNKYKWTKNIQVEPALDLSGAQVAYNYKWDTK